MKTFTLKIIMSLSLGLAVFNSQAQTLVNSLQELIPYLNQDNVNIKLAPGTYWITRDDVDDGLYSNGYRNIEGYESNALLLFEGDNGTFDFTGVTINVETMVFKAYGRNEVYEVHTTGNNNVIKNLTLFDDGNSGDNPNKGACSIVMDGQNNLIEGFHSTVRGSYPYGYGDCFGKGGSPIIYHYKHSAALIRGNSNHLKNCTFIHKAYGHGIFMQAANDPIIEGCYVEGELRTTDDMLAEEGTGSPADNVGFITEWGYKIPAGYTMSLQEDGIRTYNAGRTLINEEEVNRGTTNVTILNCTVKNMRGGVKITASEGTKLVQGCTVLNCEVGYASGTGDIVDCKGNANVGPLLSFVYENGNGLNADITVLPSAKTSDGFNNGSGTLAYVGGRNHNITFRGTDTDTNPDQQLSIKVSGDLNTIRHLFGNLDYQNTHDTYDSEINNFTGYPIVLADASSDNTVVTCGPATDNGSNNSVSYATDCELVVIPPSCTKSTPLTEAECYDDYSGIQVVNESVIGYIENGDWASYDNLDLTDMNSFEITYASETIGGTVEVRLDAVDGTLIGELELASTGSWETLETASINIDRVEGAHTLYLVFTGTDGYLFDLDKFGFSTEVYCNNSGEHIEAECYDFMSGIQTENCSEGTANVGWIQNQDWVMYSGIDFTDMHSIKARVSGTTTGNTIEVRLDEVDGELIGEINVTNTGGYQNWVTDSANISTSNGIHVVYLVFTGGTGYLYNINWLEFSEDQIIVTSTNDIIDSSIEVFPNPFNKEILIKGGSNAEIELWNCHGQLIGTYSTLEAEKISTAHLSNGIYYLKIQHAGQVSIHKVMKE